MENAQTIIANTNPSKIVLSNNMIKAIYGKKQIVVNYDNSTDLFNIWAFTLKGINFLNETKINGLFIEDLKTTIEGLK
jgi:hypothetical protein